MKTSKINQKDRSSKSAYLEGLKNWMDNRSSRTAIVMAVILFISFSFFCYTMVQRFKNPPEKKIMQEITAGYDSASLGISSAKQGILDDFSKYMILQQIKEEVEEMQRDSSKRDTVRINELIKMLELTAQ